MSILFCGILCFAPRWYPFPAVFSSFVSGGIFPQQFFLRLPPAGNFLPIAHLRKERASGGPLFPAAGKVGKRAARDQWSLDSLYSQEFRLLWAIKGIDSATDPLPLPLRGRGVWVCRRGGRIATASVRTGFAMTLLFHVIPRKPSKRRLWRMKRGGFEEVSRFSRHNVVGNRLTRRCRQSADWLWGSVFPGGRRIIFFT